MTKEEAKKKIAELVDKYKRLDEKEIKSYNEANTRRNFIELLFAELGWSVYDRKEVSEEERASKGRVDYAFKLNGISQFYLEAKALKENLNKEEYIQQAVEYAYNKGVTWAILSNFESTHIYAAQTNKLCLNLQAANYVERFDDLWLLSRESFASNLIAEWGVRYGHLPERQRIEDRLFQQLKRWRDALFKQIHHYNRQLTHSEINEIIQRFFNRLIFIRNCEDRKIENNILKAMLNEWRTSGRKGELIEKLQQVFHYFADPYDSDLFEPHLTDSIYIESTTVEDIINGLYKVPGSIANYDFSIMEPDVLGSVYEQYLGYITYLKKKDFEEQQEVTRKHRKEQGIYYTPTFVTNYIVKETVGHFLKDHTHNEILNMKILDPACGSGSFLIRAFDELLNYHAVVRSKPVVELDQHERLQVLLSNIFGVDLDKQAVEIARLNLLLRSLTERGELEMLENNIQRGNSIISGTEKELKNYFGKNWKDKEPFNWEDKFPNIMANGGFDVVIGNPPWVSLSGKHKSLDLSQQELQYLFDTFHSSTYAPNLYEVFIWRALGLLKDGGIFSFIIPDRIATNQQFIKLREHILQNFIIERLLFRYPFPGVIADTMILVIRKAKPKDNSIEIIDYPSHKVTKILQRTFSSSSDHSLFFVESKLAEVFHKIASNKDVRNLSAIAKSTSGCGAKSELLHKKRISSAQIKVIKGENIGRYDNRGFFWFDFKDENLSGRTRDEDKLGTKEKILIRKTGSDIIATFDDSGIYPEQSLYFVYGTSRNTLLFIMAVLNSRLINVYYRNFAVTNRDTTPQLKNIDLDKFPIVVATNKLQENTLVTLANKMLELNKKLQKAQKGLDEWHDIQKQIEQTDNKIDTLVYDLYELTEAERRIVESAAKQNMLP
jgi:type I restriction-modification system DNA methylase subunit